MKELGTTALMYSISFKHIL